jgi:glycosyltransferase involved in cell wall biosynthesis
MNTCVASSARLTHQGHANDGRSDVGPARDAQHGALRILVLTDRFIPEIAAPSFRVLDHAREWLKDGHEVTVVTCVPNFPHGRTFPGYRNGGYQEEVIDGVRVIRLFSYMAPNRGVVRRILDNLSFAVSVAAFARRFPDHDVILATSPPLFVALAGSWLARIRRRPWVFEVRDLWPASVKAVGAMSSGLSPFEKLEMSLYRSADRIVSLTEAFRLDMVARGIPREKIDVVTNGVDTERFSPEAVTFDARERLGLPQSAFVAGYIGTVGMAHGLETLLDAAELLMSEPNIRMLIMGEGAERPRLEEAAEQRRLSNVVFQDFVPQDDVSAYIAALDVGVVHLRPDPVFLTVIPSKIFEFMAMRVPMVYAVEGESAQIVANAAAGVCVPSGGARRVADEILALSRAPELCAQMGRRGQQTVTREYSRHTKARLVIQSLHRAIAAKASTP